MRPFFGIVTTAIFLLSFLSLSADKGADNGANNAVQYESRYSSISEAECRLVEFIEEGGSSVSDCPSFNGIKVQLLEGDLRQSLNLIRKGREYPLNLWSAGFSELGKLIEWRSKKNKPGDLTGLIVRLNVSQGEDAKKTTSYLMVSKITPEEICLIGKISPKAGENQNQKARDLLDSPAPHLCLDDPRMILDGLVFRSKEKREVGLRPDGKVSQGQWQLSFKGDHVQWQHSDMVESGTFSMSDNGEIKAKLSSRKISGAYDGLDGLDWDGVLYNLVK